MVLKSFKKLFTDHFIDQNCNGTSIIATDRSTLGIKVNVPLKNCKVVLKDITINSVSQKGNMSTHCQGNACTAPSCGTIEKKSLQEVCVRQPVTWY